MVCRAVCAKLGWVYRAGVQTWCKVGVQSWVCRTGLGVQDWYAGPLSRVGVQGWVCADLL